MFERAIAGPLLAGSIWLLAGCAQAPEQEATGTAAAIIYGRDDRRDAFEAAAPFADIARSTAVALFAPSQLRRLPTGAYAVAEQSYGELETLCQGERFAEQPAAASCSGVLLTPRIVATAGHCLGVKPDGSIDCTNNRYVLGYTLDAPATLAQIEADRVLDCKRVLVRVKSPADASCRYDFALLELERAAARGVPATLRAARRATITWDTPPKLRREAAARGFPAAPRVRPLIEDALGHVTRRASATGREQRPARSEH